VDEDSQARAQLNLLRADGHDVVAIGELAKNGTPDPEVFDLAQLLERVLLTHNAEVKNFQSEELLFPERSSTSAQPPAWRRLYSSRSSAICCGLRSDTTDVAGGGNQILALKPRARLTHRLECTWSLIDSPFSGAADVASGNINRFAAGVGRSGWFVGIRRRRI
jgi:hypothetical protein